MSYLYSVQTGVGIGLPRVRLKGIKAMAVIRNIGTSLDNLGSGALLLAGLALGAAMFGI